MGARRVHLVGTLGQPDVPSGMELAMRTVGGHLNTMPDGEPGDRADWVTRQVERLGYAPGVRTLKRSRFDRPPLRPWNGAIYVGNITQETLALPYAANAAAAMPVLCDLAHAAGLRVRLQVDIAGPLDLCLFEHGPLAPRYYSTHVAAAAQQIDNMARLRATYQLSLPLETYLAAITPAGLRARVADRLARRLARFVAQTRPGSDWIVHLCVGDSNGQPLITLPNMDALVELSNAIWRHWPCGYRLDAVHLPAGDGTHPAPADPRYFAALRRIELPTSVHLSLGLAHLGADLDTQRITLTEAEVLAQRVLGVSTPCGLGRRPAQASALLARMADLA